jgi:hypothetical protein
MQTTTAELHNEALFKGSTGQGGLSHLFLTNAEEIDMLRSLPPATILSVPVYDFAIASQELQHVETKKYYDCCGKNVCKGRFYSFCMSGNNDNCSFCNAEVDVTDEVKVAKLTTRVEANDSSSTYLLAHNYYHGLKGLQQDRVMAIQ